MKNKESRRIVPISVVTLAALIVLAVFEALVIGGAVQLESAAVAKWAPWAYESFLRLTGEHPDALRQRRDPDAGKDSQSEPSAIDRVTGLSTEPLLIETNVVPDIIEVPAEEPQPVPEATPTNAVGEIVPVG